MTLEEHNRIQDRTMEDRERHGVLFANLSGKPYRRKHRDIQLEYDCVTMGGWHYSVLAPNQTANRISKQYYLLEKAEPCWEDYESIAS